MAWLVLVVSGFLEAAWAISLKMSDGFSRLVPSLVFGVTAILSIVGLSWAMKQLPVGPAYAAWTGIGAALTAVIGMVWLHEAVTVLKLVSLVLIIAGVIGLNLSGAGH